MDLRLKRAYEEAGPSDGKRVLVDRMWPRGLPKEKARIDLWMRELAPSDLLREWFSHREERWQGFRERYGKELDGKAEPLVQLRALARKGRVTLVYAAKSGLNNAAALKEYMEKRKPSGF